MVQSDKRW
ncbi:unnamed protein product, partial [Rotaria sordida]